MEKLIRSTTAYRIFCGDAAAHRLSHAYMLCYCDAVCQRTALKLFAVQLFGFTEGSLGEQRILKESYSDCKIYPAEGKKLTVENASEILSDSALRPVEGEKKLYILEDFSSASAVIQNKLLKALEEPPAGVYFLLGATNTASVLPTVRSRVRSLEIPPFPAKDIYLALERRGSNRYNREAAESCGGLFGAACEMTEGDAFRTVSLAAEEFCAVKTLADAGEFAAKYGDFKDKNRLLAQIQARYCKMLKKSVSSGDSTGGIGTPALLYALENINKAYADVKFNANFSALLYDLAVRVVTENDQWKKL